MGRGAARAALGVSGRGHGGSLAEAVQAGPGWRPVLLLAALSATSLAQGLVLVQAPLVAEDLGLTERGVGNRLAVWPLVLLCLAPLGVRLARSGRRQASVLVSGALTSLGLVSAACATRPAHLVVGAALGGAGAALGIAARRPLLADLYPPRALLLVLNGYRAASLSGLTVLVLLVGPVSDLMQLSWRAGLLLAAVAALVATGLAVALPDPPVGGQERAVVRRLVRPDDALDGSADRHLRADELVRRVYALPTARTLLGAYAFLGVLGFAVVVYGGYLLQQEHGTTRGTVLGVLAGGAAFAALLVGGAGSRATAGFDLSPQWLLVDAAVLLALGGVGVALAGVVPWGVMTAVALGASLGCLALVASGLDQAQASVLPAALRPVGALLAALYAAVPGVVLGGALLSVVESEWGLPTAFVLLGVTGLLGALVVRAAGRGLVRDFDGRVGSLLEREEVALREHSGGTVPLLECRRVDFAYGPLQVLFGVDLHVDDGEMVALLGTNGAGKSTILRVISGLGRPSGGSVRYRGEDITYLDSTGRVQAGITQIPGGKAVFGPLSVIDNLRLFGYALGRDRAAVDRGIEESLAAFPRLAERRSSPSATLSGGEQQMLAMSKALILKPRLLLIDELSLGLAPKVVGELLAMVRTINSTGTAVVLVEQSVNVALSLADRAYFMEKGTVRFDGPTADLLDRGDILRSVFLKGAAEGLGVSG